MEECDHYEKNIEIYQNFNLKKLGKEKAKEEYLESIIYDLDILGKKHASDDIFHLTANEITNQLLLLSSFKNIKKKHKEQ